MCVALWAYAGVSVTQNTRMLMRVHIVWDLRVLRVGCTHTHLISPRVVTHCGPSACNMRMLIYILFYARVCFCVLVCACVVTRHIYILGNRSV